MYLLTSNKVILNPPFEGRMIIQGVLVSVLIYNDVSQNLAALRVSQMILWKTPMRLEGIQLFINLETSHHIRLKLVDSTADAEHPISRFH